MKPIVALFAAALAGFVPARALASDLSGGVSAGAGVTGNLNHSPTEEDALADGFVDVWGELGLAASTGLDGHLFAGLDYSRTDYFAYDGLSAQTLRALGYWSVPLRRDLDLSLRTTPGYRAYTESARNAFVLDLGAATRYRASPRLSLSLDYTWKDRIAQEAVYSSRAHRVRAGAELRLLARAYLSVRYGATFTSSLYYEDTSGTASRSGNGSGHKSGSSSTFGDNLTVVRDDTVIHTLSGAVELPLGRRLALQGELEHAIVNGPSGNFTDDLAVASLRFRF